MGVTISINPNRADVELNLAYAEEQLLRARKKATAHYGAQPYLANKITVALGCIHAARRLLGTAKVEQRKAEERRWGKR